jgi:hypothetical protein
MNNANDSMLRQQLVALLREGQAHMTFEDAVADFPPEHMNATPPHVPYSPWQLLEHMRITQRDILDFIRDPQYLSPPWPEGYWPAHGERADFNAWQRTVESFLADRSALEAIIFDPTTDLYAPLPAGERYTILREILVVADHNAYHTGEFAILRQVMNTWPAGHR